MATQFAGGVYVNTTFVGTARSDIQSNLRTQLLNAGWSNVAQTAGQGPGNTNTVTITIATPGVVTWGGGLNHGFLGGERIILQTTGALPTGLSANTAYFVKYINATTFNLSLTSGGANINTTGSQSGVHTLNSESFLMESGTQTNVTNPLRVRLKDNRGACIQVSLENQAGTVVGSNATTLGSGGNILPGVAKTYRIIATKYQFVIFTAPTTSVREFVMVGMLYVPSFLTGVTDHGYLMCNSSIDNDATLRSSIRSQSSNLNVLGNGSFSLMWNGSLVEAGNTGVGNNIGSLELLYTNCASSSKIGLATHYRWANDKINTSDILMSAGLNSTGDEGKIKGQLFDVIFIPDAYAGDTTDTFNSHNWFNITQNYAGNSGTNSRGGLWIAVS